MLGTTGKKIPPSMYIERTGSKKTKFELAIIEINKHLLVYE